MIRNLSIENFRIFDEKTEFEISPITIFTGPNNSGKSTFIRALRLLVESAKSNSLLFLLKSNSETNYLTHRDISKKNEFTFFEFTTPIILKSYYDIFEEQKYIIKEYNIKLKYKNVQNEPLLRLESFDIMGMDNVKVLRIFEENFEDYENSNTLAYKYDINFNLFFENYLEQVFQSNALPELGKRLNINKEQEKVIINQIKSDLKAGAKATMNDEKVESSEQNDLIELIQNYFNILWAGNEPPEWITGKFKPLEYLERFQFKETLLINENDKIILAHTLKNVENQLLQEFKSFVIGILNSIKDNILTYDHYIPAFRGKMLKEFDRNDNERISKMIFKLKDLNKVISSKGFVGSSDRSFTLALIEKKLFQFANGILRLVFNLNLELFFEYDEKKQKYELFVKNHSHIASEGHMLVTSRPENSITRTNLIDMGSGMYHLILFLVEIELAILEGGYDEWRSSLSEIENDQLNKFYSGRSIHTVVIEEPELSLHPNYQSLLADIIETAHHFFGVKFIIETHSEYLIRKLQLLRAKNYFNSEMVLINYMSRPRLGKIDIRRIRINDNGSLSKDFGSGFFDEADRIALDLFLIKKHQTN